MVVLDHKKSKGYSFQTLDDLAKWIKDTNYLARVLPKGWKRLKNHEPIEDLPVDSIVFGTPGGNRMAFIWEEDL